MIAIAWLLLSAPRGYEGPRELAAVDVEEVGPAELPPSAETDAETDARPPPAVIVLAPPAPPPELPRTWVVGGFVDAGYAFDSNLPDNHVNRGNFTAPRTGELTIPYVATYIRHDASEKEPWSFELAFQAGPAATALVATDPQPGGDASQLTGTTVWQHLGRGNVGGRVPKSGTEISAGLFNTPISYWSFWTKDNWNYSSPWHLNAVPYVLMGGRISQPIGKRVVLQGWVVEGYQTYADINKVPSYMVGAIAVPIDGLQIGHFDYFGPEDVDASARAWRLLDDTWVGYERGRFGIVAVFDIMRERLTAEDGEPVALYLGGGVAPRVRLLQARGDKLRWYLAGRGEAFWDRDGRIYGVPQLLGSGVINTDLHLWNHLIVRLEYRYDRTDNRDGFFYRGAAIHDDDDGLARDQHTVYAMLTGTFEHWFATRRKR